jgi:hypothetical protein
MTWSLSDVSMKRPFLLISCASALAFLALGCGIGSDAAHQEPLSAMRVTGARVAGEELRVELDYRQTYPVDVDVECDLKQNGEVVQKIGSGVVPASPGARPDDTPVPGKLVFPFTIAKAGEYRLECLTPADVENKLKSSLSIAAR